MGKVLEIGKAVSPSHFVGKGELKNMKRILVSYGGGMGGANKTYYTEKIHKEQAINGTWNIVDIHGNMIELNPRFIVEVVATKVVVLKTNTTGHANYNSKTCKSSILTEYFDLGEMGYNDYVLKDTFRSSDKIKTFHKESETI